MGDTPLIYAAAATEDSEVITTLLEAGADIEAKNNRGITPLIQAAMGRNPEVIEALLKAGANAEAKDEKGKTAIGTPFIQHSRPSVFPH